jgi:hypothetical protein
MFKNLLSRTTSVLVVVAMTLVAGAGAQGQTGPTRNDPVRTVTINRALHVLSVGIGISGQPGLDEDIGMQHDAELQEAFWTEQQGKGFDNVFHEHLLNNEARRAAIIEHLEQIYNRANAGDRAVITMSSHGGFDRDNRWVFCAYDADLSDAEIRAALVKIARKGVQVILILESCHSGGLVIQEPNVIVLASAQSDQVSWGGGGGRPSVFIRLILEALEGAADTNHDGVVTLAEVTDYVTKRMEEEMKNPVYKDKQAPVTTCPANVQRDLPLTRIGGAPQQPERTDSESRTGPNSK